MLLIKVYLLSSAYVKVAGRREEPPHIHILVRAGSFLTLMTQHYPDPGKTRAVFDLVLVPVVTFRKYTVRISKYKDERKGSTRKIVGLN